MRTRWIWSIVLAVVAAAVVIGVIWQLTGGPPAQPGAAPAASAAATSGSATSAPASSKAPAPSPAATGTAACVDATVAALSLEEQVGQLLMVGTPVANPRTLTDAVSTYHLGGIFLAGRSKRTAGSIRQDVEALQRVSGDLPLLVALDQEGGAVQTLRGPDFPDIPSAVTQGGWSMATLHGRTADSARRLAATGVNLNLAPVADTVPAALGTANPPIGAFRRQYGSDPDAVARDIRTVVAASQDSGVLTTLKHFPGLGRVRANTDTSTKAVDTTTTARDPYLKPFAAGMQAGSAAVMVSSASYPKLDSKAIAAFSTPIITGLLRRHLGYPGLVMSDDLGAAAAVASVRTGDRAVRFIGAGGDLVLTVRPQDAAPMTNALLSAAEDSPAFAGRVSDAVRHVVQAKYRAGLMRCPAAG
jgi:beta-N-acetylhexosaminidase